MQQNPTTSPTSSDLHRPDLYINRELSWIEFNRRVLEEAQDSRHPLLERVKFLSIFETNLDEFIMIRLAGLKDQVAAHVTNVSPDGLNAEQQLRAVRQCLAPLVQQVRLCWRDELMPLLEAQHIHILDYEQLDSKQRAAMRTYFEQEIFPVLTPLAPVQFAVKKQAVIAFVWIEQVIAANLSMLFPGFEIWESYPFRVLRDADIELIEDDAGDLMIESIEQGLRERRFGSVVDLAVNPSMPLRIRSLLLDQLEITPDDLTVIDGPLGMGSVMELHQLDRPDLKDPPFIPRITLALRKDQDLFAAIRQRDLLIHLPYDTFDSVVEFIRIAASDPDVLAIKQTLYRVGSNSPVVKALLEAVENGKQVAVLVELKARFDEENNIKWANALVDAGVHVVYGLFELYGLTNLKTHAKIALVVRKEADGLRRYVHLGTGNYNATTARIYEDLSLLTCRPEIGADASALFNLLTGYSRQSSYSKLLVAPLGIRKGMIERIEREIALHLEHGNGHLVFKMNSLVDPQVIHALYRASQAGVRIDLIVRGICSLRPGVEGVSETIHVRSLVGRFLEHSRVYYFRNGGDEEILLGSADMMQRNLDHRVETLFPIEDPVLREAILERLLKSALADTVNARELMSDGRYVRVQPAPGEPPFDCQKWFISHSLLGSDTESYEHVISAKPSGA